MDLDFEYEFMEVERAFLLIFLLLQVLYQIINIKHSKIYNFSPQKQTPTKRFGHRDIRGTNRKIQLSANYRRPRQIFSLDGKNHFPSILFHDFIL